LLQVFDKKTNLIQNLIRMMSRNKIIVW